MISPWPVDWESCRLSMFRTPSTWVLTAVGSSMRKAELGQECFGLAAQLSVVSSAWCCMSAGLEEVVGSCVQGLEQ